MPHRILEKKNPFLVLAAAGLSRLVDHMFKRQWGIVSAHHGSKTLSQEGRAENNADTVTLKDELRKNGVGFIDLRGAWKDNTLNQYIPEDSLFLVNVSPEFVKNLAVKYAQEGYIVGAGGKYQIVNTATGEWKGGDILDHLKVETVPPKDVEPEQEEEVGGYSQIGGKRFHFANHPVSFSSLTAEKLASKKYYFCEYGTKFSLGPVSTPDKGIFHEDKLSQSGRSLYIYLPLE